MAHLKQQFADALRSIEPDDDKVHAPEAHQQVRDVLMADATLSEYGVNPVLIGSYKRSVSIKRVKDVDVFVRLPNIPKTVTSGEILDRFFNILNVEFGTDDEGHRRTKRQDKSLQISFPEFGLYVDAVPARPFCDGETWEIPQKGDANDWVHTNPEKLTSLTSEMNSLHDGYYVPTVKLLRQTRRSLLGLHHKPGGFFIEAATYQAFNSGQVHGNDQAEYYVSTLKAVSDIVHDFVSYGIGVKDSTLPGHTISIRATSEELENAKTRFDTAAATASDALGEQDEGKAALAFRKLLGKNGDDEIVFPMPPGFNDNGSKRAFVISPGSRVVPAGMRTFG
ncbi:nucleotidyltransferase [Bifidobacterium mongoliense]|uniref:nucleotidyltransferase n=1 Tax=Bifidobacterium mongoliense TaxID=518643 RepID=UPI0030EEF063